MKIEQTQIQLAAIILVVIVIVIVLMPSSVTGIIDDSVMKFVKVFGVAIQGLIFGVFASGDGSDSGV